MTNCKSSGFNQSDYSAASALPSTHLGTAQTPDSATEELQRDCSQLYQHPAPCFHNCSTSSLRNPLMFSCSWNLQSRCSARLS